MALTKKYGYYIQGINGQDKIGFVEDTQVTVGTTSEKWSTITSDGLVARIYGSKIPSNLSVNDITAELPLPHFIDEAALNFIIAAGYEDPRNLQPQMSQMFSGRATALLKQARKKFSRRKQNGGHIKPVDF